MIYLNKMYNLYGWDYIKNLPECNNSSFRLYKHWRKLNLDFNMRDHEKMIFIRKVLDLYREGKWKHVEEVLNLKLSRKKKLALNSQFRIFFGDEWK